MQWEMTVQTNSSLSGSRGSVEIGMGRHLWRVCWVPRLQTRGQVHIIDFSEGMG